MKTLISNIILYLWIGMANAQIPSQVPKPSNNTAVDWNNLADVIIYLGIPCLILVFFIFYKFYKKKTKL